MSGSNTRADRNDDTELDLMMAQLHYSAAKKAMCEFWGKVAKIRGIADPGQLLSTVSKLDHHEQTADAIFRKLIGEDPNNVGVLRAYALFLQDIKDNQEQANALYQAADDIEDLLAQAQRKRRLRHQKEKQAEQGGRSAVKFGESVTVSMPEELEGHDAEAKKEESDVDDARSRQSFESSASSAANGLTEARAKILQPQGGALF